MKIFGYKDDGSAEVVEPSELAEITLVANPDKLRKIAKFIETAAERMENQKGWEHEHLSDKFKEFATSPHFVVFKPNHNQRGQVLQSRTRPNMALNRSAVIMQLCFSAFRAAPG